MSHFGRTVSRLKIITQTLCESGGMLVTKLSVLFIENITNKNQPPVTASMKYATIYNLALTYLNLYHVRK